MPSVVQLSIVGIQAFIDPKADKMDHTSSTVESIVSDSLQMRVRDIICCFRRRVGFDGGVFCSHGWRRATKIVLQIVDDFRRDLSRCICIARAH